MDVSLIDGFLATVPWASEEDVTELRRICSGTETDIPGALARLVKQVSDRFVQSRREICQKAEEEVALDWMMTRAGHAYALWVA